MPANVETMFYVREKPWHGLVLHPARNRTRPWAGFPHGCVIVLYGRQPDCVLCLALQKSRSKSESEEETGWTFKVSITTIRE